ncbi:MAG: cell division protein ZapD [Candidatus Heimdallarchaeota archaeon]
MLPESTLIENQVAENGFYQQNLNTKYLYQLIRILVPNEVIYFAEISAENIDFVFIFFENINCRSTK